MSMYNSINTPSYTTSPTNMYNKDVTNLLDWYAWRKAVQNSTPLSSASGHWSTIALSCRGARTVGGRVKRPTLFRCSFFWRGWGFFRSCSKLFEVVRHAQCNRWSKVSHKSTTLLSRKHRKKGTYLRMSSAASCNAFGGESERSVYLCFTPDKKSGLQVYTAQ